MREILSSRHKDVVLNPHIWWGISVENRNYGLPRIQDLRSTPAAVRFLSIEPLLEDVGELDLQDIHWVIVGGESGPGARPMQQRWVESIMKQCHTQNVPFFFKQWGGVRKKEAGRKLNGRTFDEFPKFYRSEFPQKSERMQILRSVESRIANLVGALDGEVQMGIFDE